MFNNLSYQTDEEGTINPTILCVHDGLSCAIPEGHRWYDKLKAALDVGLTECDPDADND